MQLVVSRPEVKSLRPAHHTSHHTRDVTLREGASRIRKNPGGFAGMRSWASDILRCNQSETIPQDRFAAAIAGIEAVLAMTIGSQ